MDCMYSPWGHKELDTTARLSPVAQMVKNLPTIQETWVRSLGREDPLEEEPTPVFLAGEFHGQRSLEGYSP